MYLYGILAEMYPSQLSYFQIQRSLSTLDGVNTKCLGIPPKEFWNDLDAVLNP